MSTPDIPQEGRINLAEQKRQKFMFPGEVFLGDWKKGPERRYSDLVYYDQRSWEALIQSWNDEKARLCTADWAKYYFAESGLFRLIREIPAISRLGRLISSRMGIVAMPKLVP
ncbi:hypothetical protein HYW41_03380 [Candidatus Daviesbacteria bacterium]|nr:hypothetical protein [Candidatus Daviesbacteria bacterium]